MVAERDIYKTFSLKIIKETPPEKICPYLVTDGEEIYCSSHDNRNYGACDHFSLQQFCLEGSDAHRRCIFHPENEDSS